MNQQDAPLKGQGNELKRDTDSYEDPYLQSDDESDDDGEEDFAAIYEQSLNRLESGKTVKGRVVKVTSDEVIVDVGSKSEGIIPLSEFTEDGEDKNVYVGQEFEVYIVRSENADGLPILSRSVAKRAKGRSVVRDAYENKTAVRVKVQEVLKGGLRVISHGVTGFMPFSHTGIRSKRKEDAEQLLNQEFDARVIEMRGKRDVIFSRRVHLDEQRAQLKERTLDSLTPGQNVKGIVKNLTQFGAFVDIGGVDGLLHVNDMAWHHVAKPHDIVNVGSEIHVVVLGVEGDKISLGLKQLTEDPWESVVMKYPPSSQVHGKVTSLVKYGAFVELEPGIEGLIHISEMSWTRRLKHPSEMFNLGDEVDCVVLKVDDDSRRISLGYKQITDDPYTQAKLNNPPGTVVEGEVIGLTDFGAFIRLKEGVDGMIHVSDMSWTEKVQHPSEKLKEGDRIQCTVLEIDAENQRISLGLKQVEGNPWEQAAQKHKVGSYVDVRITKVTDFGVFAELEPGVEGLAHISELAQQKITHPSEVVHEGETFTMKITKFDVKNQKLSLSLKAFMKETEEADVQRYMSQDEGGMASLGEIINSALKNQ